MTLAVITFLYSQPPEWAALGRQPYSARHVNALYRAVGDNLSIPHRFVCFTDQPEGIACETRPVWPAVTVGGQQSCYRKLRAFDGKLQRSLGDVILCLDLDAAVLGSLDPLITDDAFRIMRGSADGERRQCSHYNGSMWLCRAGARDWFWRDFDPDEAARMREELIMPTGKRVQGSDQAYLSCVSPNERTFDPEDGVLQYHMYRKRPPEVSHRIFRRGRIVFFAGPRKPWGPRVARTHPQLHAAWARYDVQTAAA